MKKKILEKKIYSKPIAEVIEVDHEISLVMLTFPDDPPGSAQQESPTSDSPLGGGSPTQQSDPFGGDSPSY